MDKKGNGLRRRWWLAPLLGYGIAVWVCLDRVVVGQAEIETVGRVLQVLGIALVAALFTGLRQARGEEPMVGPVLVIGLVLALLALYVYNRVVGSPF